MQEFTPSPFVDAYDPEHFRKTGHEVIDILADYLQGCVTQENKKVLTSDPPETVWARWNEKFHKEEPGLTLPSIVTELLEDANHLQHPRYVGHQVSAPLPDIALADTVASLLNNSSVVYEMGPAATALERICARWMADKIGFGPEADGIFTSGGTLGNLTAMLTARQAKADYDIWTEGVRSDHKLAVLVSEQAHYCVQRAIQILGLGAGGGIPVKTDENFHLDLDDLKYKYEKAVSEGYQVIAVSACATSTATGSFDDLNAIADFCEAHDLWLHVDCAHGGSTLLSEKYRYLMSGLHRADSVVWDPHKMMALPIAITGVIFADGKHSHMTFSQNSAYLLSRESDTNWFDMGMRTLECSKTMMTLKLYCALKLKGEKFFGDYIDYVYGLTKWFADLLKKQEDFEILTEPQCNILCFRYTGREDSNEFQDTIRQRLSEGENFYIVKTTIEDRLYLRITVINPMTSQKDLFDLMEQLRSIGQSL